MIPFKHWTLAVKSRVCPAPSGWIISALISALASTPIGLLSLPAQAQQGLSKTTDSPNFDQANDDAALSADTRLERLRNAILDKALAAPNRIRSFAWVDESGVLRENLQISTDIKLRGIRVQSYLGAGNTPETRLLANAEEALTRMGAHGCADPVRIKRHASLSSTYSMDKGRLGFGAFGEIAALAESKLLFHFSRDDAWVLTRAANPANGYERLLVSSDTPLGRPYSIQLHFEVISDDSNPPPALEHEIMRAVGLVSPRLPGRKIRMSLNVEEHMGGRTVWQRQTVIAYPPIVASLERQSLPDSVVESIEQTTRLWQVSINKAIACEPVQLSTKTEDGELISIDGGSRIGLRVGDQLLLVDGTRYPKNLLEAGTLSSAALIEIREVAQDRSTARRIAGRGPAAHQPKWFALPL